MGIWEFSTSPKGKQIERLGMRRLSDHSPRRLSDISSQLRQLRYLTVEDPIKEELKSSRSFLDVNSALNDLSTVEVRILRITGYYRHSPWSPDALDFQREKRTQSISLTTAEESESSENPSKQCCHRCPLVVLRKLACGVALACSVAVSWAGTTHTAKMTLTSINAPFFLTWFATTWNVFFFPLYYLGHICKSKKRQTPLKRFRECSQFLGEDGFTLRVFWRRTAPFCLLWVLTNYFYLLALWRISPSDASAIFCCNKAFVFLLSWIILKDRFMGVRIVAAILSITGIVMMAYADGFHSDSIIGVALAVGSASSSALYKVLFRLLVGDVKFGEAAVFLTTLGVFNILLLSWICVILYITKVEYWPSVQDIPWEQLCSLAALLLAFNLLVNFGIALTYPTLISVGVFLSVPVNSAVDLCLQTTEEFSKVRLAATGIIGLGFLLLLLPEEWDETALRCIERIKRDRQQEESPEDGDESGVVTRGKSKMAVLT
ncbi:putative thiamine transporter SLC35F3 [Erpetoichthys calabaricus]|uniref:putative thiamine transporter SLC35F3 n=1 Tax=Erpetoichthys calabaricus TaxID=27687 RepID=UPI0022343156|nr:putative thiamine transporter SLC35F3 [Erpetoichthys calabaricus]